MPTRPTSTRPKPPRPAAARTTAASRGSRSTTTRRRSTSGKRSIAPEVVKSLIGIAMALLGAAILIGLILRGQGALTDWTVHVLAPWFGRPRWLLPFLLLLLAYYLERAKGEGWDWQLALFGTASAYLGVLGIAGLVDPTTSGRIGKATAEFLAPLVTHPGAAILLGAVVIAGTLLTLDMSLPAVVAPLGRLVSRAVAALSRPAPKVAEGSGGLDRPEKSVRTEKAGSDKAAREAAATESRNRALELLTGIPAANASAGPSSTFAPPVQGMLDLRNGGTLSEPAPFRPATIPGSTLPRDGTSIRDGAPVRGSRSGSAGADAAGVGITAPRPEYHLPPLSLLEDIAPPRASDSTMDHARNAAIIAGKLASFNIPARVVAWNAGPVVTQYEVAPSAEVKVSRIEALSDDLAMALSARTIRIEAPIPGKSVIGIEIPNKDFNIVSLRRILEEVDFHAASRLTFALGRDVAGHARAADLGKMPHLLIAGATGSGKSVMVNALITSLLCNSTPDEVRMILMDLKRVELSAYNGLPHLMVPVITEPERAKAALKWAVVEMENRYRRFAGATARNITTYNETRADPADQLPHLVIIIDELADLMMREGRNIEDPIVRLAQKARATGIHMVLATQRPSVNVVTGLIKANFPSRIAFAMASQIDSRTILDMPGAEDLIGRGDMLFQPADLPRPIRLQGVYVSDKEIANICDHWRAEAEPHYDMGIITNDEETSTIADTPDDDADRLMLDAVGVIEEYDRASASLLQRRLKIGYARAARIIDQLEARGYIGPFDGSNARQVLRRDGNAPAAHPNGRGEDEQ